MKREAQGGRQQRRSRTRRGQRLLAGITWCVVVLMLGACIAVVVSVVLERVAACDQDQETREVGEVEALLASNELSASDAKAREVAVAALVGTTSTASAKNRLEALEVLLGEERVAALEEAGVSLASFELHSYHSQAGLQATVTSYLEDEVAGQGSLETSGFLDLFDQVWGAVVWFGDYVEVAVIEGGQSQEGCEVVLVSLDVATASSELTSMAGGE